MAKAGEQVASIEHSIEAGIATIVLNQPGRRNAMKLAMWEELGSVVREVDADPGVKLIILRGSGREAFSAGADISEFEEKRSTPAKAFEWDRRTDEALKSLVFASKPSIAMIYGACVGGGCEMALTCDLRIASEDSYYGVPAARLGISVNAEIIKWLVDIVGPANAKYILFTGNNRIPASRALAMGLVNEVVSADQVESRTHELANEIMRGAPLAVSWAKRSIEVILRDPDLSTWPERDEQAAELFGTDDFKEGAAAFLEKRQPRFTGH